MGNANDSQNRLGAVSVQPSVRDQSGPSTREDVLDPTHLQLRTRRLREGPPSKLRSPRGKESQSTSTHLGIQESNSSGREDEPSYANGYTPDGGAQLCFDHPLLDHLLNCLRRGQDTPHSIHDHCFSVKEQRGGIIDGLEGPPSAKAPLFTTTNKEEILLLTFVVGRCMADLETITGGQVIPALPTAQAKASQKEGSGWLDPSLLTLPYEGHQIAP